MAILNDNWRRWLLRGVVVCGTVLGLAVERGWGDDPENDDKEESAPVNGPSYKWNLATKTLGGRQLWGDVLFYHEWRIQKHVLTGHFRLIDGADVRHAWGTLEECQARLEEIKQDRKLGPMSGKAVILVHGLVRSSKSFSAMRARMLKKDFQVYGFDYPSTRAGIHEAAANLHTVLESMEGIEEISFVVHSMGGLVVRAYLAEHRDPRIRRMVMLGVPNAGAELADRLHAYFLYKAIYGPAGQQLISASDGFIAKLPTPDFEFAILAGGRGNIAGYNPLIPGDDDGTVSVTSARLPGAADFALVRCLHSVLMRNEDAIDMTARFLQTGRLREDGDPHPIPPRETEAAKEDNCKADAKAEP